MPGLFEGYTILVVDDEPDLREIIRDEFEFEGAKVIEAENGKKAFTLVQENKIDAVISDIRMPGGDGATMAREIKARNHDKPVVILITGFAGLQSDEAYEVGVDGFITKPFNLSAIRDQVHRLLQSRLNRWSKIITDEVKAPYEFSESYQKMIESGKARFGRGGFCVQGDFVQFRAGDLIKFSFPNLSGVGQFNWIRTEATDKYLPSAGIEILSLNENQIAELDSYIQQLNPRAFIPR